MYPNIATSVRLLFSKPGLVIKRRNWWIIENTIVVEKTVPSTYFGVIQLPGIYAGLQQLPSSECGDNIYGDNLLQLPYYLYFSRLDLI